MRYTRYMNISAQAVTRALRAHGSKQKAKNSARFFKTGVGEYGHGDVFIGVTVPEQRVIARRFRELPLREIDKLLRSELHECRLTALHILLLQTKTMSEQERARIARYYLSRTASVNNWDLVDASAPGLLGETLYGTSRDILYTLARSKDLWRRRIAIVATYALIRRGELRDTFRIAMILMGDKEDLMHKAVGWMLREAGKRSRKELEAFLHLHATTMPRTMLRYAIERFSPQERRRYLDMKKTAGSGV